MQLLACASLDDIAAAPRVSLRNVAVQHLDMSRQTFLLSFDMTNPNAYPLPVKSIRYSIELDGQSFASGSTPCALHIPAGSDAEFVISVELDLLRTAPGLMFVARDATRREISYALEGELGFDLPAIRPAHFREDGVVRLQAAGYR